MVSGSPSEVPVAGAGMDEPFLSVRDAPVRMAKRKINICFACKKVRETTEHHVKEHAGKITVELCRNCHVTLNHYQEKAMDRLKKFLDGEKES